MTLSLHILEPFYLCLSDLIPEYLVSLVLNANFDYIL